MTDQSGRDREHQGLGRRVGGAIGEVFDVAFGTVGQVGAALGSAIRMPGLSRRASARPGDAPGIDYAPEVHVPPSQGAIRVESIDFDDERLERAMVDDLERFLAEPRPEWARVRWVKVEGLHPYVVNLVRRGFEFHTLAAEDVLSVPQRPRADAYEDHLYIVTQLFVRSGQDLSSQQVSMFVREDLLVTFQERADETWEPIFSRLQRSGSVIRTGDASYLAYALLDTVIDHAFPVLEGYAERLEELEDEIMGQPGKEVLRRVHAIKRELSVLQRVLWPTRELVATLSRGDQPIVAERVRTYLRDAQDHCVQLTDMLDTCRELAGGLTELHLSMTNNRMGEVMHLLTLLSSVFIPITFVAGVYGMNFSRLPELQWEHGYEMFWGLCAVLAGGMLWYFRRRGWLGRID